jgi:hypothetical protein
MFNEKAKNRMNSVFSRGFSTVYIFLVSFGLVYDAKIAIIDLLFRCSCIVYSDGIDYQCHHQIYNFGDGIDYQCQQQIYNFGDDIDNYQCNHRSHKFGDYIDNQCHHYKPEI